MQTMQTSLTKEYSSKYGICYRIGTINVLTSLLEYETQTKDDCKEEIQQSGCFIPYNQCMMTLGHGQTGALKQCCTLLRQGPWVYSFQTYWWPYTSQRNIWGLTTMLISPYKAKKQHYLRLQKQLETYQYPVLYCFCVITSFSFTNYITKPKECNLGQTRQNGGKTLDCVMCLPRSYRHSKRKQSYSHKDRPRRNIHQVVWVNLSNSHVLGVDIPSKELWLQQAIKLKLLI